MKFFKDFFNVFCEINGVSPHKTKVVLEFFILSSNEEFTASAVPFCLICVEKVIFLYLLFISLLLGKMNLKLQPLP